MCTACRQCAPFPPDDLLCRRRRPLRGRAQPPLPFHRIYSTSAPHSQGGVEKYLVKVGDAIAAGDRIAEVSTDKATVDFDVVDDGIVAKFLIPEGTQDVAARTSLPAPAVIAPSPSAGPLSPSELTSAAIRADLGRHRWAPR